MLIAKVCGLSSINDNGFGDGDHITALPNREEIEWIAFSAMGPPNAVHISGIEIKYQATPAPFVHGIIIPTRRIQLDLDISKKEHLTQVRIDCGGPPGNKRIQFISLKTNRFHGREAGTVNPRDFHIFSIAGKRVAAFKGHVDPSGTLRNLGLVWANVQWGNWPYDKRTRPSPGGPEQIRRTIGEPDVDHVQRSGRGGVRIFAGRARQMREFGRLLGLGNAPVEGKSAALPISGVK